MRLTPVISLLMFLIAIVGGATIALKANTTEDRRSALPLIVSIPSKVSRANKPTSNDIFDRPLFAGLPMKASLVEEQPLSLSSFTTVDFVKKPPSTEATTTSTARSTTEPPVPSPAAITTTTRAPPTTEEVTKRATSSTTPMPVVVITVPTSSSEAPTTTSESEETTSTTTEAVTVPSTTESVTAPPTTESVTVSTTEATTPSSTVTDETTVADVTNGTSAQQTSPDVVVEKDYGLSLGVNGDGNINGHSDAKEPDDASQDEDIGGFRTAAEEDAELEEPSDADAEEQLGVDTAQEEEDPLDLAAQASEIDYAVVAPAEGLGHGDFRDVSALRDPRGDFPEHRSIDFAIEQDPGISSSGQSSGSDPVRPDDTDVRTSMTYSVAVLHPLGEYDATPDMIVQPKNGQTKKSTLEKFSSSSTRPRPALALPAKKTSGKAPAARADSLVVVMDTGSSTSSTDDPINATLLVINASPDEVDAPSGDTVSRPSQNTFYSRRYRPRNTPTQLKGMHANKDLETAESVQEPVIVEPDEDSPLVRSSPAESAQPSKSTVESAGIFDSELEGSQDDPAMLSDDGEYEYVYEYIDLNSTDIPDGAIIVTDEQLGTAFPIRPDVTQAAPAATGSTSEGQAGAGNIARPPTFRTYDPTVVINPAELSLTQGNGSALGTVATPGQQSIYAPQVSQPVGEVTRPGAQQEEGVLPFLPGMPDSPVYFVGIQREKLGSVVDHDQLSVAPAGQVVGDGQKSSLDIRDHLTSVNVDAIGHPASVNVGANAVPDGGAQGLHGSKGNEAQLMSLYALSKALPIDDSGSLIEIPGENGSSPVFVPADLPDPFSDDLLDGTTPNISVIVPSLEASSTEATTTIQTSTVATSTETSPSSSSEAPAKVSDKVDSGGRGARPRGSRRSTTTVASTNAESDATEAAATSEEPPRRTRPTRLGGRRRTTTMTAATADDTTAKTTVADDSDKEEKATTTEKPRFGGRSRSRTSTTARSSRVNATPSSESDANGNSGSKDKESNTIAANGATKRPFVGRRTTTARTPSTASDNEDVVDKQEKPTRGTTRQTRGRRTSTPKSTSKAADEKPTTAPSAGKDDADEAEGDGASRKAPLFRPRNQRNRFGPKAKTAPDSATEPNENETPGEGDAEQKHDSSSSPAAEASAPKQSDGEAEAPNGTSSGPDDALDNATTDVPSAADEDDATTEASGPPRKFPPRFRPGSRATIPHKTTEASA